MTGDAVLRGAAERTVAVLAAGQGSGVMLAPRLVLTSAHVLRDQEWIRTAHPDSGRPVPSRVVWRDGALDVALLLTGEELVPTERWALGRLRWGAAAGPDPLPGCQVVGFPEVQRFGREGQLECDQFTGTVLPLAGRVRATLVCEFDRAPVAPPRAGGRSPLAGLSGAPLFAGAVLIGIVTDVPDGRDHRRVEAVPVAGVLEAAGFPARVAGAEPGHLPSVVETVSEVHLDDERFERHYARALQARYRKTEIFGIDELGTTETSWDLDTAYLSLEAMSAARPHEGAATAAAVPRRVNDLLADRPRAVLRGEAGAGKTTLVWWLASHAACGTLGHDLSDLNGLVPFVVPMRSLPTRGTVFPGPQELPAVAELPIDGVPAGWARRVLEAGRALLLVDGMDEVPPPERESARTRLADLLAMYPHNRCLVTVRPLAVAEDWLGSERFDELRLLPLRDEDVLEFSTAWHAAARLECAGYRDAHRAAAEERNLHALERALKQELSRNETLRSLTRTPLLCAVVCALHRRRRGFLPDSRWSLYNAALQMLLGGRDTLRRVTAPEGISLGVEEHQQLLQRIAAWLARGGFVEFTHDQARHQIELAMRGMPQVRDQGTAEGVLTHLLNRSGLLQERGEKVVQFIHRTFQDYLAAKEIQESDGLGELLQHAGDEQWQDIVLLAVGHCNRGEVRRLIEGLVERGDAETAREARGDLHVLAARCAQSAVVLDEELRGRVAERVRALVPPADDTESRKVASLGAYVLPLVPGPEGLGAEDARAVVKLVRDVGGPGSLPLLRRFTRHEAVRGLLVGAWTFSDDVEEYAREVLAHLPLDDTHLVVVNTAMVAALRHCGPVGQLDIAAAVTGAELAELLPHDRFRKIVVLTAPALDDLSFVRHQARLRSLVLMDCPKVGSLAPLHGLPLTALRLELGHLRKADLAALEGLGRLTVLSVEGTPLDSNIPLPPGHPTVERLRVTGDAATLVNDLSQWPALRKLSVTGDCNATSVLLAASRAPALTELELTMSSLHLPRGFGEKEFERYVLDREELISLELLLPRMAGALDPLPRIRALTVRGITRGSSALDLSRVFPNLTRLALETQQNIRLDLSPLREHRDLTVEVNGRAVQLP